MEKTQEEVLNRSVDWLNEGVLAFSTGGDLKLNPELISRKLSRSMAEFNQLFPDEGQFLYGIVEYWRKTKTTRVVESFMKLPFSARIEKLVDRVFGDRTLHDFLFHLRRLAQKDETLALLLAEIEEERINSTRIIFNGLGFGVREIDIKGELLYSFYLGWYERYKYQPFTPALRAEVLDQISHLIDVGN